MKENQYEEKCISQNGKCVTCIEHKKADNKKRDFNSNIFYNTS